MPVFLTRYDSPFYIKWLSRLESFVRYRVLRPVFSFVAWNCYWRFNYGKLAKTKQGARLKPGISVVIPARNEEYSIKPCLESLIGVVDQFILIDNGSDDQTLAIMKDFKKKREGMEEIIILEMPGATLLEMRQKGLDHVSYSWMIRGDADMVFTHEMKRIRAEALKRKRPAAIYLQYFNLYGDPEHQHRIVRPFGGEYYLRNFDASMKVVEYFGRYEHARIPIYYRMVRSRGVAFFHLNCSKPNERLIFRTCYLDWREAKNTIKGTPDFEEYQKLWTLHNFGTLDTESLQFRYSRLIASSCVALAKSELEELPVQLKNQIREAPFQVFY
jgi:glycosyltransferase involved in cell wall biosynthesis